MAWLVYQDAALNGTANMARDQLMLRRAAEAGQVTLRLYEWDRPTLSLGRNQKLERELDLPACEAAGVPLVRRATGGQAVLHGRDLTYSVAAPLTAVAGQGVLGVYQELSRVLLRFFQGLGLEPTVKGYAGRQRAGLASAICFSTPSAFEILVEGRKLVGSAQRQTPRAFLQHGSIPLVPQPALLARLFKGADEARMAAQMTDLTSLGVLERWDLPALRQALVASFAADWGADFLPGPWGDADEAELAELAADFPLITAPTRHQVPASEPAGTAAGD